MAQYYYFNEDRPDFTPPTDPNVAIWRYMSFAKFVAMLQDRALFFARSDKLGDPFEGSYTSVSKTADAAAIQSIAAKEGWPPERAAEFLQTRARDNKARVMSTYVNCWHVNEHESDAMWKLYCPSGECIAVRSTYAHLIKALPTLLESQSKPDDGEDHGILVGLMRYIDYEQDAYDTGNVYTPFAYKRRSFEHERELRAALFYSSPRLDPKSVDGLVHGLDVPVNLDTLIDRVYVSPTAAPWFDDVVRKVLNEYRCSKPVQRSRMKEEPIY